MNGECVSYRMGDPITWEVFKTWPEEHQKTYILNVREKFKVPGTALAKAMGTEEHRLRAYVKCLGLAQGKEVGGANKHWHESEDAKRFWAWWNGEEIPETAETPDLKEPMTWYQFKDLSNEQKIEYINWIRFVFGAPDKHIAETLFRISPITLHKEFVKLDLCVGKNNSSSKKTWDKESFIAWCNKNKKPVEEGPVTKVESTFDVDAFFANAGKIEENIESIDESSDIPEETVVGEVIPDNPDGILDIPEGREAPVTLEKTCDNPCPIEFTGNCIPVIPKSGSMSFENNRVDDILQTLKVLLSDVRVNLKVEWECAFE